MTSVSRSDTSISTQRGGGEEELLGVGNVMEGMKGGVYLEACQEGPNLGQTAAPSR